MKYILVLLTVSVRETPVYHFHVFLFCGQNSASCSWQLVQWQYVLRKRLQKKKINVLLRYIDKTDIVAPPFFFPKGEKLAS